MLSSAIETEGEITRLPSTGKPILPTFPFRDETEDVAVPQREVLPNSTRREKVQCCKGQTNTDKEKKFYLHLTEKKGVGGKGRRGFWSLKRKDSLPQSFNHNNKSTTLRRSVPLSRGCPLGKPPPGEEQMKMGQHQIRKKREGKGLGYWEFGWPAIFRSGGRVHIR